jgi:hypothetical protein
MAIGNRKIGTILAAVTGFRNVNRTVRLHLTCSITYSIFLRSERRAVSCQDCQDCQDSQDCQD